MKPIRNPKWINWLISPKYCFALFKLRFRRLLKSKEGRRILFKKTWIFVKRNALFGSVVLLTIQINNERRWRRDAELIQSEVEQENKFIRGIVSMLDSDFKDFPNPRWKKLKRGNRFIMLDLSDKYTKVYGYSKTESLGKTNEQIFGDYVGGEYTKRDLELWKEPNHRLVDIEPSPEGGLVLSFKYGRITKNRDSLSSGYTMPLKEVLDAINEYNANLLQL